MLHPAPQGTDPGRTATPTARTSHRSGQGSARRDCTADCGARPRPARAQHPRHPGATRTHDSTPSCTGDCPSSRATIRAWAAAWSAKDVDAYLGFYAPNFVPPERRQRGQWERERRTRILKNGAIEVRVGQFDIRVAGAHAVARFQQEYRAPTLAVSGAKELRLSYTLGRWRIIKETVLP